jgi:hypothetical protein
MMRPNKLKSLETLSSQVLEFEGKARTQLEQVSNASFLGKLLVFPPNVRLDWKVNASYKHWFIWPTTSVTKKERFYEIETKMTRRRLLTVKVEFERG